MNPLFTLFAAAFAIFITIIIIVSIPINCSVSEGFDNVVSAEVMTCPAKTTMYTNSKNVIGCCDSSVNDSKCSGKTVCAITTNKYDIPLCNEYLKTAYSSQSKEKCPPSMPNYFMTGGPGPKQEFCTNSQLNSVLSGPADSNAKTCSFENYEFDIRNPASCIVQKLYDNAMCPNKPCQRNATTLQPNKAVVIQVSFVDKEGNPRTCYDDTSMKNYYRDIKKDLAPNNINLCSVSKQVYIEQSLPIGKTSI
jgi:hypothetical protein